MARADIHVFGSKSGYRTVAASPGIRPDETRELEQFQFGEISTSDAIARLDAQPTMTIRMLGSGRIALSRMLPAGVDDAGRPTIEVVTLALDARVLDSALGALEELASESAFWREAREKTPKGIDLPSGAAPSTDPRDPALLRILDAWMFATRSGSVAVLPESATQDLLRFVATLDPSDRRRCRWGIGINSLSAPVDVCTMMPGASTHGARSIVRPAPAGQWHVRETEFAQFRATSGGSTWVPTTQMIGGATVMLAGGGGGDASDALASNSTHRELNERQKRVMVMSIIAAICSSLLFTAAAAVYIGGAATKRSDFTAAAAQGEVGPSDATAALPPLDATQRSGFGDTFVDESTQATENPVAAAVAEPDKGLATPPESPVAQAPPPPPSDPPTQPTPAPPTSTTTDGVSDKNDTPVSPPEVSRNEPTSQTMPADPTSMYISKLREFQKDFEDLPEWKHPDQRKTSSAEEAEKQKLENEARSQSNKDALDCYLEVLWRLHEIDDSWREMKRENHREPSILGGMLSKLKTDREDENVEFLKEWRMVANAAYVWTKSFTREGEFTEKQLKQRAEEFGGAKVKNADHADKRARKDLDDQFPRVLTSEEWRVEVENANTRLEKARKKLMKSPEGD